MKYSEGTIEFPILKDMLDLLIQRRIKKDRQYRMKEWTFLDNKKLWTQVFIALLLDIDVRPGNETAGKYSHGALCNLLDNHLPRHPPGRSGETYGGQDLAANAAERDRKANRCSCSYQILG